MSKRRWEEERQPGRERGSLLAAEKYSRFLQPPLPVSAGHDCDGKPETKPAEKTPSAAGLVALSASQKAALHYTPAFVWARCRQWGDLATIHLCSQRDAALMVKPGCCLLWALLKGQQGGKQAPNKQMRENHFEKTIIICESWKDLLSGSTWQLMFTGWQWVLAGTHWKQWEMCRAVCLCHWGS